ncbi:hypothetical protein EV44_g4755 [Erysiphe necator]|uniref:Uncharacterized protein n=1 Tax=Uncinula necator TaxID=52586 RepID=A0A0B1P9W9_UNCNE|nr:hypothetical protein EV44_g4755 [Erysiphe necator]
MALSNVSTPMGTQDLAQLIIRSCNIQSRLVNPTNSGKYVKKWMAKYFLYVKKLMIDVPNRKLVKKPQSSKRSLREKNSYCCEIDTPDSGKTYLKPVLSNKADHPRKKIKIRPIIISEIEVQLSPSEINSLELSNKPCIALGDLTCTNYETLSTIKTSRSDVSFSRCISPTIERYREGIYRASQALSKTDDTARVRTRSKHSYKKYHRNDATSHLQNSWKQSGYISIQAQKPPRHQESCQTAQHHPILPTKRIGRKNYYVFTFPKPPTGPGLASLFHQLTPKKGYYLQVIVKYNDQMKDPLWATLLQSALSESCVKELCIAIGRMYVKFNLGATNHIKTQQNLRDVSKAISILNKNIKAGGQSLRNMVNFLLKKLEKDSIEGKWGKREQSRRGKRASSNPVGYGIYLS